MCLRINDLTRRTRLGFTSLRGLPTSNEPARLGGIGRLGFELSRDSDPWDPTNLVSCGRGFVLVDESAKQVASPGSACAVRRVYATEANAQRLLADRKEKCWEWM